MTANTIELLTWIAARPRSYSEAIDAWHSHCPRLTIWEDALIDGLIKVERSGTPPRTTVVVTQLGQAAMDDSPAVPAAANGALDAAH